MGRTFIVNVNPSVLKWLRESAGWSIEDVGVRLKIKEDKVHSFESGDIHPTLKQLKELSTAYKRPLAAFFLPEPRKEKDRPKDYRMLPDRKGIFDKKTVLVLRNARTFQELCKELSRNIEDQTRPMIERFEITQVPDSIAEKYREIFGLTEKIQRRFKTPYELFNFLRDKLEDLNIFIFQDSMPIEDARGFALTDDLPNVIVLSTKDLIEARIFTMMHEFAHILLGKSAIDLPVYDGQEQDDVEIWCNEFASEFLFPKRIALDLFNSYRSDLLETNRINRLSKNYKVSKGMLLLKMLKTGMISRKAYEDALNRYKPQEQKPLKDESEDETIEGGISSEIKCLSRVGTKFVSLVADNYDRDHITYTDALNFLSIRSKHFDKVLAKARR